MSDFVLTILLAFITGYALSSMIRKHDDIKCIEHGTNLINRLDLLQNKKYISTERAIKLLLSMNGTPNRTDLKKVEKEVAEVENMISVKE